jgi:hypothetical protein
VENPDWAIFEVGFEINKFNRIPGSQYAEVLFHDSWILTTLGRLSRECGKIP